MHGWISHAVLIVHGQTPIDLNLRTPDSMNFGEFPVAPPREYTPAVFRRRYTRPLNPSRPILKQRPRLEPSYLDLNRPIQIQAPRSNLTGSPVLFA